MHLVLRSHLAADLLHLRQQQANSGAWQCSGRRYSCCVRGPSASKGAQLLSTGVRSPSHQASARGAAPRSPSLRPHAALQSTLLSRHPSLTGILHNHCRGYMAMQSGAQAAFSFQASAHRSPSSIQTGVCACLRLSFPVLSLEIAPAANQTDELALRSATDIRLSHVAGSKS